MSVDPSGTLPDTSPRYRGSLAVCVLLIAYASLYPFWPLRPPAPDALAWFFSPRYMPAFDLIVNTIAYFPLGALACLVLIRRGVATRLAMFGASLAGLGLSIVMEASQLFIPFRVASIADVGANAAGAILGALAFAPPLHALVTRPLGALRERLVIAGAWGDAGLVLLALWLIAQLNPALPFFEAGNVGGEPVEPGALGALQAAAVALSVCGFGLFVSVLLKGPGGALRTTLMLLTVALWMKFMTASLMLKPHISPEWISTTRVGGLLAGLAVFVPLRALGRTARTYLAILMVAAGALFSKIFGAYSAIEELLRLFNWPHGQLASFTTLTRFLHESWPLAALVFLVGLFIVKRENRVP